MKNNIGQVCVEFNKTAVKLFTFLYKRYEKAAGFAGRKKDEILLLQLNNQYINTLKQQLNDTALSILDKYKITIDNIGHLQQVLTGQISFYLNEFNYKSELLFSSASKDGHRFK